jgi:hypothetical protein
MRRDEQGHLNKDELVMAVVDEVGLAAEMRKHLALCRHCVAEKERLARDLAALGEMAKGFTPPLRKTVIIPDEQFVRHSRPWGWQLVFGTVLATAVVVIMLSLFLFRPTPGVNLAALNKEMLSDERLMTEISMLENNPMPLKWEAITGETNSMVDEAFIDFVVPLGADDEVS